MQWWHKRFSIGDLASSACPQTKDGGIGPGPAELAFENVERRFGDDYALRNVDLTIKASEVMCMLGPSGCGKTTLLRIASGVEQPSAGRVLINQVEVAGPSRFVPPEKRNVGLMFQDFALFPHLTIVQNVAFGLVHLPDDEAARRALMVLERMGLSRYANHYPHVLSGGQQQRVALARAIAPRPSVILMDEPFSGLDLQLRDTIQEEALALLRETRSTGMIVTHSPEEAMTLGDRIAVMNAGEIAQVGTAEELFRVPNSLLVARLFSDLNEVGCTVRDGAVACPLGSFPAEGLGDGTKALLCIRHRAIQFVPAGQGHPGRILRSKFLGDVVLLDVEVDGFERPLKVRGRERRITPLGTEIGIEIDRKGVLVFPADGQNEAEIQ